MFRKMQNVETAFRYVRMVSLVVVSGSMLLSSYVIYNSYTLARATQEKIYVLANGKVLEAFASERKDNIAVEAKDHVKMFHHHFFTLSPDDQMIQENISKALYLADGTAKRQYDNLSEENYYANIISANISQSIRVDSVHFNTQQYPYYFRCYARQELTRPTSILWRRLVTEGYLRNVDRSENNSHGLLIERWKILENVDIDVKER